MSEAGRIIREEHRNTEPFVVRDNIRLQSVIQLKWNDRLRMLFGARIFLVWNVQTVHKVGKARAQTHIEVETLKESRRHRREEKSKAKEKIS